MKGGKERKGHARMIPREGGKGTGMRGGAEPAPRGREAVGLAGSCSLRPRDQLPTLIHRHPLQVQKWKWCAPGI
jgi:hypothetical protein